MRLRLLLDSHVLLWWNVESSRLPRTAYAAIKRADEIFVSAASVWELTLKHSLGKLRMPNDLEAVMKEAHLTALEVSIEHALATRDLPRIHDDPFDRLLVAQARLEGLRLLTCDEQLTAYGPEVLYCD